MNLPVGPGSQPGPRPGAHPGARAAGRRAHHRVLAVLLGVLVLLAVEVWLLAQLSHLITGAGVLALLLVETLAGALVLRRAGRRALGALRTAAQPLPGAFPGAVAGAPDAGRMGDAVLVGAGGALLVLPGVLSDVLALVCLLPPTRALLRRLAVRLVRSRVRRALRRAGLDPDAVPGAHPGTGRYGPHGPVVQGEVVQEGSVDGEVVEGELVDDGHDVPGGWQRRHRGG
ncbi:FxsA family protein [Kineococcus sp. G2]|uniref:FxsA family protein n=1 Tax=Kineococcus sp. G2 TaxID=3127484 RepID=UPI00301E2C1D